MTMPTHSPDQQPWGAPGMQPPAQPRNGLGTTALVLGIVGLVFAIIPFLFWLGAILGLLALIFGIVGASRAGKGLATNKGMAVTGLVLGAVSVLVAIVWTVVIATAVKDVADELEKEGGLKGAASSSAEPSKGAAEPSADPSDKAPEALKFGETFTYEDGIKVTVSKPRAHKPDEFAAGFTKGNKAFQVTVTIVNGSKEAVDITAALPNASDANGAAAEMVFDGSYATKPFEGKVLPGKQAKADFTFGVKPDAAGELQVEISPTVLDHDSAVWTGPTK
ncbi:DUF4190 domain-containing protein [Streptomyces showdoensis]|uniref:Uncharacterized protein n=1 Tax=Streptomyces showdoensis TaxID=68268 RepID=A0A2P2GIZ3_STREW|nr:DUF4190 domain-containing protein [Streptomyces showdoensis]KKZ71457.1 hypothetical protein VO63_23230 [Streptomyces showdoensis]